MTVYADLRGSVTTLLTYDGEEFTGGAIVQGLGVKYTRRTLQTMMTANNRRAFSEIGDAQPYIDYMRIQVCDEDAVDEIQSAIGDETSQGTFVIEAPQMDGSGYDNWLVRFFGVSFTPDSEFGRRRPGNPRIFTADVTDIEVLGHTVT